MWKTKLICMVLEMQVRSNVTQWGIFVTIKSSINKQLIGHEAIPEILSTRNRKAESRWLPLQETAGKVLILQKGRLPTPLMSIQRQNSRIWWWYTETRQLKHWAKWNLHLEVLFLSWKVCLTLSLCFPIPYQNQGEFLHSKISESKDKADLTHRGIFLALTLQQILTFSMSPN